MPQRAGAMEEIKGRYYAKMSMMGNDNAATGISKYMHKPDSTKVTFDMHEKLEKGTVWRLSLPYATERAVYELCLG